MEYKAHLFICSLLFAMSKINSVLCNVNFKNYEGAWLRGWLSPLYPTVNDKHEIIIVLFVETPRKFI